MTLKDEIADLKSGYSEPKTYYDKKGGEFMFESYRNWAFKELMEYLAKNRSYGYQPATEKFRETMDEFACAAKTPEADFMFSTAYDVATDVLDFFIRADINKFEGMKDESISFAEALTKLCPAMEWKEVMEVVCS